MNLDDLEARVNALPTTATAVVDWFVDIDGVLNVLGDPKGGWDAYARANIAGIFDIPWPLCWSPRLVRMMNVLAAKKAVNFRWLTTWEHDAPARFAPAVGLEVGAWVAGEDLGDSPVWWKLDVIVEHLRDATDLMIWTDDDIADFLHARRVVDFLHPDQAVVICPDRSKGLTPSDFALILGAIEKRLA